MAITKARRVVMSDELWEALGVATEGDPETNRSSAIRQLVRWYVGEPGAELPVRPSDARGSRPRTRRK